MSGRVWVVNSAGECCQYSMLLFTALMAHRLGFRALSR